MLPGMFFVELDWQDPFSGCRSRDVERDAATFSLQRLVGASILEAVGYTAALSGSFLTSCVRSLKFVKHYRLSMTLLCNIVI